MVTEPVKSAVLEVIAPGFSAAEPAAVDVTAAAELTGVDIATMISPETLLAGVSSTHVTGKAAGRAGCA